MSSLNNLGSLLADWAKKGAAIQPLRMCKDCAFKKGTDANSNVEAGTDAADCLVYRSGIFHCHLHGESPEDNPVCQGFLMAKSYLVTKETN